MSLFVCVLGEDSVAIFSAVDLEAVLPSWISDLGYLVLDHLIIDPSPLVGLFILSFQIIFDVECSETL